MFKVGDRIKCIDIVGGTNLKLGNSYLIIEVKDMCYWLENAGGGWFHTRFILDIKGTRKQKLNKICLEKVIE